MIIQDRSGGKRASEIHRRSKDLFSKFRVARWALASFAFAACLFSAAPAHATEWKICNASAEDAEVVIVYGTCSVVFSGNLPVTGVFLRAEGVKGDKWEGSDLFCTLQAKFELPNANKLDERACEAKGGHLKAFHMHVVKTKILTTTLSANGVIGHKID